MEIAKIYHFLLYTDIDIHMYIQRMTCSIFHNNYLLNRYSQYYSKPENQAQSIFLILFTYILAILSELQVTVAGKSVVIGLSTSTSFSHVQPFNPFLRASLHLPISDKNRFFSKLLVLGPLYPLKNYQRPKELLFLQVIFINMQHSKLKQVFLNIYLIHLK